MSSSVLGKEGTPHAVEAYIRNRPIFPIWAARCDFAQFPGSHVPKTAQPPRTFTLPRCRPPRFRELPVLRRPRGRLGGTTACVDLPHGSAPISCTGDSHWIEDGSSTHVGSLNAVNPPFPALTCRENSHLSGDSAPAIGDAGSSFDALPRDAVANLPGGPLCIQRKTQLFDIATSASSYVILLNVSLEVYYRPCFPKRGISISGASPTASIAALFAVAKHCLNRQNGQ